MLGIDRGLLSPVNAAPAAYSQPAAAIRAAGSLPKKSPFAGDFFNSLLEPAGAAAGTAGRAPAIIAKAGRRATKRFFEFFTANIRNKNTREAYYRALGDFFAWCDDHRFSLVEIEPIVVAAYIEYLVTIYSKPTVKQHLAAIRMCFDWLVTGQVLPMNPAASVRGPSYVINWSFANCELTLGK